MNIIEKTTHRCQACGKERIPFLGTGNPTCPECGSERIVPVEPPSQPCPTSRDAAEQIKPCAAKLRTKVYEYIRSCGDTGATDDEIQAGLMMEGSTQRPRRVELCNAGKIYAAPATRRTRSGRLAQVWRAA